MKILVGIPTIDRRICTSLVLALLRLEKKHEIDVMFQTSSLISMNRNKIANAAHLNGYDYLLFIDSDIDPGVDFFEKMAQTAKKLKAGVVGGAYRLKDPLFHAYVALEEVNDVVTKIVKLGEPRLVKAVGTGLMLITKDALEKIKDPRFTVIDLPQGKYIPEDFNFCDKATKAGVNVAFEPRVNTIHYGIGEWKA